MKTMNSSSGILDLSRLLRSLTLLAWAGLFIGFDLAGRLPLFLAPGFRPFVFVSGVILGALGLALLFFGGRAPCCANFGGKSCDHRGERLTISQAVTLFLLLALIGGSAVAAPRGFSAKTVLNRMGGGDFSRGIAPVSLKPGGGALAAAAVKNPPLPGWNDAETEAGAEGDPFDPRPYFSRDDSGMIEADVMDLWAAAADPGFRKFLADQTILVTAQILKPPVGVPVNPGAPRFKLVRMMVTCCAADARPISVPVYSETLPEFDNMTWVQVEGRLIFRTEAGEQVPYLKADQIRPGKEPEEVYLFN